MPWGQLDMLGRLEIRRQEKDINKKRGKVKGMQNIFLTVIVLLITGYLSCFMLAYVRATAQYVAARLLGIPVYEIFIGSVSEKMRIYEKVNLRTDIFVNANPIGGMNSIDEEAYEKMSLSKKIAYLAAVPLASIAFAILATAATFIALGASIVNALAFAIVILGRLVMIMFSFPSEWPEMSLDVGIVNVFTFLPADSGFVLSAASVAAIFITVAVLANLLAGVMGFIPFPDSEGGRIILLIGKKIFGDNAKAMRRLTTVLNLLALAIVTMMTINLFFD